jgi:hypothetical protein
MPRLLLALALLVLASLAQASDGFIGHSTWANWRGSLLYFAQGPGTGGVYVSNEPLIPPQCRKTSEGKDGWWGAVGIHVDGQNINFGSGAWLNPGADCNLRFAWTGRIMDKKPIRLCTVWNATMPSGQVITGWDTFWLVRLGEYWPQGPWVWRTRPKRDGCGHRGYVSHGPQRLPDPTIPLPPIQPPPSPSPSPYVR